MTNKVIVVVGSSRGIGRELVLQFAQEKSNTVIALSRNIDAMDLAFKAENIHFGYIDLTSKKLHEEMDAVLNAFPKIDVVINNAGRLVNKAFLELTRDDIDACYQTNAIGVMHATQYVVPRMLENGGHIVNISTIGAFQGSVKFPGLSAYSTSKAGITSFTELFAEEYKDTKIKMNCLCLGAVQTEMLEEAFPGLKAPVSPAEMAEYIVDFTFNAPQYFNGKILPVSSTTP
ncbi:SDR family NAD(P)-dependent oxidoreductase [Brumimicrobium aurantiacum]|uniref:SDR family oxidoreductase n=1 Tax=Brumimicrobium aurantiacum TaxID=1737063 RepID=A0A3E1EVV2_9FLAO|nr:SDR family oxidoreductase [Brumimicrobium aurantiacum]RFC53680.1 SDR family oxidoreductase [Brumimicrobium aurantiacum]